MCFNKIKTVNIFLILNIAFSNAYAGSKILTSLEGQNLTLIGGKIFSTCISEDLSLCQNIPNSEISSKRQKDLLDRVKAINDLRDMRMKLHSAIQAQRNELSHSSDDKFIQSTELLTYLRGNLQNLAGIDKDLAQSISALSKPIYDFDSESRYPFRNLDQYNLFKNGTLLNMKPNSEHYFKVFSDEDLGIYRQFSVTYRPEMKMQFVLSYNDRKLLRDELLERWLVTCEQKNVYRTLTDTIDVKIPFTEGIELQCTLPNKRGFLRFAAESVN